MVLEIRLLEHFRISMIHKDSTIVKFRFCWKALGEDDCFRHQKYYNYSNILNRLQHIVDSIGATYVFRCSDFQKLSRLHHRTISFLFFWKPWEKLNCWFTRINKNKLRIMFNCFVSDSFHFLFVWMSNNVVKRKII